MPRFQEGVLSLGGQSLGATSFWLPPVFEEASSQLQYDRCVQFKWTWKHPFRRRFLERLWHVFCSAWEHMRDVSRVSCRTTPFLPRWQPPGIAWNDEVKWRVAAFLPGLNCSAMQLYLDGPMILMILWVLGWFANDRVRLTTAPIISYWTRCVAFSSIYLGVGDIEFIFTICQVMALRFYKSFSRAPGPQLPTPHRSGPQLPQRMSEEMPDRTPERLRTLCQIGCWKEMCKIECHKEFQKIRRIAPERIPEDMPDGDGERQKECQKICQIECQKMLEDASDRMAEDVPGRMLESARRYVR